MDKITAPFTKEQCEILNKYQNHGMFHAFTCVNDGDRKHVLFEFNKHFPGNKSNTQIVKAFNRYMREEKANGINFPAASFNQTNLVATEDGWICPVCTYTQKWAHNFMADKEVVEKTFPDFLTHLNTK